MNNTDKQNHWEVINSNVSIIEKCIAKKDYNQAMVKSRQTLEFMVKTLCANNKIPEAELIDMIDTLYEHKIISNSTRESYHKIRQFGNQAVHDNDSHPYKAFTVHQLLSQEIATFAHSTKSKRNILDSRKSRKNSTRNKSTYTIKNNKPKININNLLNILILIAGIILIIWGITNFLKHKSTIPKETLSSTIESTEIQTSSENYIENNLNTEDINQEENITPYKTTVTLNVRSAPSTDSSIITTLAPGTIVDYEGDANDAWAIINYNNSQAYVSKQYIKQ